MNKICKDRLAYWDCAFTRLRRRLIAPEVILAGPGCMNNQRMAPGYYPYSPMRTSNGLWTESTLFVLPGTGSICGDDGCTL